MQPFEGVRVLDLTHVLAGPFCTFQLATLGAEVIKIEPENCPDMTRDEGVAPELNEDFMGTYFLGQSAGKKSLILDLKSEAGQDVFSSLVQSADVLVQNYSGTAQRKLGLDPETLTTLNPKLIQCSLTGYGRTGPKADHPAYDIVIQAYTGMMMTNGWSPEDPPLRIGPPVIDYGTGAQAAVAISAALYQRDRTGKGQIIDVAMADSAFLLMSAHVTETLARGTAPLPHGSDHPKLAAYSNFETAAGWITLGAYTNRQSADLMRVLGHHDEAEKILQTQRSEISKDVDRHRKMIADALMEKTAQEWEDILNEAHIPAARIRKIEECLEEEQFSTRASVAQYGEPVGRGGPDKLPLAGYTYAQNGPSHAGPPPAMGAHSREVLESIGIDREAFDALEKEGVVKSA